MVKIASILSATKQENDFVLSIKLSSQEYRGLRGDIENIQLLPLEQAKTEIKIYKRGKNGHTKYFRVPRETRKNTTIKNEVQCMKINTPGHYIWAYVMDRF